MIEKIGRPAMLEQLAEEATELAQACLKLAKKSVGKILHQSQKPSVKGN